MKKTVHIHVHDASYASEGNRNTAQRMVNAENQFIETLQSLGKISRTDAEKVMRLYLRNKLAKMDSVSGRISVKNGAYLDADVIKRAVSMAG